MVILMTDRLISRSRIDLPSKAPCQKSDTPSPADLGTALLTHPACADPSLDRTAGSFIHPSSQTHFLDRRGIKVIESAMDWQSVQRLENCKRGYSL